MFPSAYLWSTLLSASWSVDQRVIQAVSESPVGQGSVVLSCRICWLGVGRRANDGGPRSEIAEDGMEGVDWTEAVLGNVYDCILDVCSVLRKHLATAGADLVLGWTKDMTILFFLGGLRLSAFFCVGQ